MKQTVQTQTPYSVDTSSTDTLYLFIYPLLMPDGLIKIIVIPYLKNEQSKAISDNRDRLTKRGKLSYNYDNNGSLISISHADISENGGLQRSFIYNFENRLIQVKDGQGQSLSSYQYDPFGRRISKTVNNITTYYFYNAQGLIAELDNNGKITTQYGYRPDGTWGTNPLFIKQRGYTGYYQNDHLGTPQQIVSSSGQILWNASYSAFGQASVTTNVITNNLRLAGQYFDVETGLHYNYFRYYDPSIGRYISSDPIGLSGGINIYGYALQNPVNWVDTDGLRPRSNGRGGFNPYGGYPGNPLNAPPLGRPRDTEPTPNSPIRPRKGQNPAKFWREFYNNPLFNPYLDRTGPPDYYNPAPFYDPSRPGRCEA